MKVKTLAAAESLSMLTLITLMVAVIKVGSFISGISHYEFVSSEYCKQLVGGFEFFVLYCGLGLGPTFLNDAPI